ncbi:hypothetical protein BUALT_Bualt16G0044300 [Buddleja alternifolia]|uniref:Uncharacterized protein n=1 Tax=Buddleja alternifolia TaxID=168488 RepID=A0AAV6W6R1_9LAMI|nr:hypothetical protein BUALT_Bualt16G0044300 [Buddleja alternifolia]
MASSRPSNVQHQSAPKDAETGKDFNQYLELYRAALRGDWNMAERVLMNDNHAATARINPNFETALHVAVMAKNANNFVAKLVDFMPNASLAYKDKLGNTALYATATAGNIEIANILINRNPDLLYIANNRNRYPVHEAARIAKRHMGAEKNNIADLWDNGGNSLLHLCATLAPPHKLNLVSGAALQMQRELQWFKEIENFVLPYARESKNSDGETPHLIFTKEHKELKKEGEKWMRNTASS